ncbi:MAG TPA: FtsW/RodA/SpoVE family cell cycle protein, partial [Aggregatilineales bacterium]|nr:FtsW/RodA/SpoVE family cell cycle protein [Aggregatilineales bacterium]
MRINLWHIETILLGCAILLVGIHFYHLSYLFPDRAGMNGGIFAIWASCAIIGKLLLQWRLPVRDRWLFGGVMFLVGWGLVILARLTPILAIRQTLWLILGFCALLIVALSPIPLRWFHKFSWWVAGGGVILLLITFIIGVHPSLPLGAPTLWLSLNRLFIQPSEWLKFVLVGCFAIQIAQHRWHNILFLWGMVICLFMLQRDFGVATLFMAVLFQLAYLARVHYRILGVALIFSLILAIIGFFALPIIRLRVAIWLNPWVDVSGVSYQLVQSLFAFADGGVFGRGFGLGNPALIPLAHSDFIFSAIAEEWGLVGIGVMMTSLGCIAWRAMRIGDGQKADMRRFFAWGIGTMRVGDTQKAEIGRFFAWGIGTMLISQNIMIMGGALRIFPLTGMPLTFVSYGGSSLVVSMIMVGVLLRLSVEDNLTPQPSLQTGEREKTIIYPHSRM